MPQWPQKSSIKSLLNDPAPGSSKALTTVQPQYITDHTITSHLLESLVRSTKGCSIEQLEQIYSAIMGEIWRTRDDWNRSRVATRIGNMLKDVIEDIRGWQGIAIGSTVIESGNQQI